MSCMAAKDVPQRKTSNMHVGCLALPGLGSTEMIGELVSDAFLPAQTDAHRSCYMSLSNEQ